MTLASRIDTTESRRATADGDVLIGEDWVSPDGSDPAMRAHRGRRSFLSLNRSPLARKILVFNLLALIVMVTGLLFVNPFRDSLMSQREKALVAEAGLMAQLVDAHMAGTAGAGAPAALAAVLARVELDPGTALYLFDTSGTLLARAYRDPAGAPPAGGGMTDLLNRLWDGMARLLTGSAPRVEDGNGEAVAHALATGLGDAPSASRSLQDAGSGTLVLAAVPVMREGVQIGVIAVTSRDGEIDRLVGVEREQILQVFVIALMVSVGLSLVLASTIANPLSDLAAAAELGRDRNARRMAPGRIRIPDLTARPDEIGRLSVALRGMVTALYDRIDANEQFAADVAHEIKNPLASLRSAVGTMRVARREDQREKLLEVIEHDVRRLDRLVSDISNASRLDSELVREESEVFDLLRTLQNINEHLAVQAADRGVEFITDLPALPIHINGLEARLAQVFVNLITNAISFCEDGDAVRVWVRRRDDRVLVVVEDTGPGIPEQALTKIFKRFYSERPVGQFGNHSGLGLAISKQIVEAHGGVIWAENIRPTEDDATSEPLGARFVVGLPV